MLAQLREFGIRLSLDDFGTGYSTLTHLKSLPVQEVKIDRSFVARMCTVAADAAIVHAMVELAHALGIRVVAEGVEDERTWEALNTLGCDLIQGYVLSRSVPASELEQSLNAHAVRRNIESRSALTPRQEAGVQKQNRPVAVDAGDAVPEIELHPVCVGVCDAVVEALHGRAPCSREVGAVGDDCDIGEGVEDVPHQLLATPTDLGSDVGLRMRRASVVILPAGSTDPTLLRIELLVECESGEAQEMG